MNQKWIWSVGLIVGLLLLGHALVVAQSTPKQLKEEAVAILQGIAPENQRVERAIAKAVEAIRESLADKGTSLFLDEVRIVSFPVGLRVFDREAQAIAILSEVARHRNTPPSPSFTQVIHRLVQADEGITSTAIATAEELVKIGQGDAKNLEKAQRLFAQAQRMADSHQKVEQLKKAWEHAQRVADEKPFFLMVTAFHDSTDPFSPHLTSNTLNTTFQIRRKERGGDDDDENSQVFIELVEIIKSSAAIVRTIKTRQEVPSFRPQERFVSLTLRATWDGRNGQNEVVPDGVYTYVAFGQLLRVKNDHREKEQSKVMSFPVMGTILLDGIPPSIATTVTPIANAFGWHRSDVTIAWTATDNLSGVAEVSLPVVVSIEGANQVFSGTAKDHAGNVASSSVTINLDQTGPQITALQNPLPNANHWNNTSVTVSFNATDSLSGLASVTPDTQVTTEGANQGVEGVATDQAGNSASTTILVNIDQTAPQIGSTVSPPPNAAGWHKDPVTVEFSAVDGLSGLLELIPPSTTLTTEGMEQEVSTLAVDRAGNTALQTVRISLDLTTPSLTVTPGHGETVETAQPQLVLTYADTLSGIDFSSLHITLDGLDKTAVFAQGADRASFTPTAPLSEGPHTITASVADNAGNQVVQSSTFVVPQTTPSDTTPPSLTLNPAQGQIVNTRTPQLVVTFGEEESAIDFTSLQILLDNINITSQFLKLPQGASLTLTTPLVDGSHTWQVVIADAVGNAVTQSASFVVSTDPNQTFLRGRVVNLQQTPLAGILVGVDGRFQLTGSDGYFQISAQPGMRPFSVDGRAQGLALFVSSREIQPGLNVIKDIVLFPAPLDQGTPVSLTQTTTLTNPQFPGLSVAIAPGGTKNANGSAYTGKLLLGRVPITTSVDILPPDIEPGYLISIQPGGLHFDPPASLTLPNEWNFSEGTILELWDHTPSKGILEPYGKGKVVGNEIVTIEGGVYFTGCAFSIPAAPTVIFIGEYRHDNPNQGCCTCVGSVANVSRGNFREDHVLPAVRLLGQPWAPQLVYHSSTAFPKKVVGLDADYTKTAKPKVMQDRLAIAGIPMEGAVRESTSSQGKQFRLTSQIDLRQIPTGVVRLEYAARSNYGASVPGGPMNRTSRADTSILVNNQMASPFGTGWNLAQLSRLYPQNDASVLLIEGDGAGLLFSPNLLRNWTKEGLPAHGLWTVSADETSVLQERDGFPSFYVSPRPVIEETVRGTMLVEATAEHSAIGFAFGYQAPLASAGHPPNFCDFYLFDWKRAGNDIIESGFYLSRVQGSFPVGPDGRSRNAGEIFLFHTEGPSFQVLAKKAGLGKGWNANTEYHFELLYHQDRIRISIDGQVIFDLPGVYPEGRFAFYTTDQPKVRFRLGSVFTPFSAPPGDFSTLVRHDDATFTRTLKDGTQFHYDAQGLQTAIEDRQGNAFTYSYVDADGDGKAEELSSIVTPVTTSYVLGYANGKLASITDPAGRVTQFSQSPQGDLTQIVNPDGTTRTFHYTDHLLDRQTNERGLTTTYEYDVFGHIAKATKPDLSTTQIQAELNAGLRDPTSGFGTTTKPLPAVEANKAEGTSTDPLGHTHKSKTGPLGGVIEDTDDLGQSAKITRDENSLPIQTTDRRGAVSTFAYDGLGNLLRATQVNIGATTALEYEPNFNQVTKITDPLGRITRLEYDSQNGNLLRLIDPLNQVTTFTYNSQGLATSLTDPLSRTTTLAYTPQGLIASLTDALNHVTSFTYDSAGNPLTVTDPLGRTTTFTWDAMNRLLSRRNPLGGVASWEYDAQGNPLRITDENGHSASFAYDSRGRRMSSTDPLGGISRVFYDNNNNITALIDARGKVTYRQYDHLDRLVQEIRKVGDTAEAIDHDDVVSSYTYDPEGNLSSLVDPQGKVSYLRYDLVSRLTQLIRKVGDTSDTSDADDVVVSHTYDQANQRTSTVDPHGKVTYFKLDALGRLRQTIRKVGDTADLIDADDLVLTHTFDAVGNRTSLTDPNGKVTYFKFDALNRLRQIIRKVADSADLIDADDAVSTLNYDAVGNLLSRIAPNGVTLTQTLDSLNRLATQTNGAGETTTWHYDGVGNILSIELPNQNILSFTLDAKNRVIEESDLLGLLARHTYDAADNRLSTTDGNNNTISTTYDDLGRPVSVRDALGQVSTTLLNKVGNPVASVDRNGQTSTALFDDLHRLVASTNALGHTTTFTLDKVGNLLGITDAKAHTTVFALDDLYRRISEVYADGQERRFTFDKVGNLLSRTDQNGKTTSYQYSDLYFLLKRDYATDPDDTFTYDKAGRMLTANKGNWTIAFTYDGADRLLETLQNGQRVAYAYDIPNRTRTITYPTGQSLTDSMDLRGRYTQVDDGQPTPLTQYSHDSGNRLTSCAQRSGVTKAYTYNDNNWITRLENRGPGNTLLSGVSHTHDPEGNRLSKERLENLARSEAYSLDAIYRLLDFRVGSLLGSSVPNPIERSSFDLDPLGNWNSRTTDGVTQNRSHSVVNEITQIAGVSLTSDANGNLTDDGTKTYGYDEENRLVRVVRKSDGQVLMECQYDALGRRVIKRSFVPGAKETTFVYDGAGFLILTEIEGGVAQKSYLWGMDFTGTREQGGGIGGLVAIENHATGKTFQPLYDTQYNVVALIDASNGAVVATYRYGAYGELVESSGIVEESNFRFSTKYFDGETGLYWYGFRYYSPELGRWMTRDPIGYGDGMNLYEAFYDNPYTYSDSLGLQEVTYFDPFSQHDERTFIQMLFPAHTAFSHGDRTLVEIGMVHYRATQVGVDVDAALNLAIGGIDLVSASLPRVANALQRNLVLKTTSCPGALRFVTTEEAVGAKLGPQGLQTWKTNQFVKGVAWEVGYPVKLINVVEEGTAKSMAAYLHGGVAYAAYTSEYFVAGEIVVHSKYLSNFNTYFPRKFAITPRAGIEHDIGHFMVPHRFSQTYFNSLSLQEKAWLEIQAELSALRFTRDPQAHLPKLTFELKNFNPIFTDEDAMEWALFFRDRLCPR